MKFKKKIRRVESNMRHEMPFQNKDYLRMMKDFKSLKKKDKAIENFVANFGVLNKMWRDGAFDEYSDDHFIIRAFSGDIEFFRSFFNKHYIQITSASKPYASIDSFPNNFVINLENAFRALTSTFGYETIRKFVTDQLSAGKENYDEETFFEALSEIHILYFFSVFGYMQQVASEPVSFDENGLIRIAQESVRIVSAEYEPRLNGKTNPEARFHYEDGTILDVEIKTPSFSDIVEGYHPCIMPGVLLDSEGRTSLKKLCAENGLQCLLPNVSKMKDFLNSAAKKFQKPESEKHINLLCVNWTGAALDKDDITEPLIILSNMTNGIMSNPDYANKCQVSKDALTKVSAVLLYKLELGALLFSDFRYIFANGKARVVLNRFSDNLNVNAIHRITKLNCIYPENSNISSLVYVSDICCCGYEDEISLAEKVVKEHILS